MVSGVASILVLLFISTVALAQSACTTGVIGDLARYAQYNAIQIDCSRSFPQYNRGTTSTSTRTVTAGLTAVTSTKVATGVRVTSSAEPIILTVRTVTATALASTVRTTVTVQAGNLASTTSTVITFAPTSTSIVMTTVGTQSTTTITTTTITVYTTTVITTETVFANIKKARKARANARDLKRLAAEAAATPFLKKRSKEEEFQAALKAQGTSSSALLRTFCSCFETIGYSASTAITVPSTTTSTTTTTTLPTTTVTATTTTTFTTTTTPTTTSTSTSTTTATSTFFTTSTSTPVTVSTSTSITTDIITETPTVSIASTSTTVLTLPNPNPTCQSWTTFRGRYIACNSVLFGYVDTTAHTVTAWYDCLSACSGIKAWQFFGDGRADNCVCYASYGTGNSGVDPNTASIHQGWVASPF